LVIQRQAYGYHYVKLPLELTYEELQELTGLKRSSLISGFRGLKRKGLILSFKTYPQNPKANAQKSSDLRSKTPRANKNKKES